MRLMAIDYGEKRVGIASTDESGEFAIPRQVLANTENLLEDVLQFVKNEKIDEVIIGESKKLDGSDNLISGDIKEFKKSLEGMGVKVIFHTEVFTSQEAERIQGKSDMLDASAAAIILKSYIEMIHNK